MKRGLGTGQGDDMGWPGHWGGTVGGRGRCVTSSVPAVTRRSFSSWKPKETVPETKPGPCSWPPSVGPVWGGLLAFRPSHWQRVPLPNHQQSSLNPVGEAGGRESEPVGAGPAKQSAAVRAPTRGVTGLPSPLGASVRASWGCPAAGTGGWAVCPPVGRPGSWY